MTTYRVIGSGPVALACAMFMVRGGIAPDRVRLRLPPASATQARPAMLPRPDGVPTGGARRMLALSEGSRQLLTRIIAMPPGGLIERIEVTLAGRSGRTRIDARDFGVAALGHVVPYPELIGALHDAAALIGFTNDVDETDGSDGSDKSDKSVITVHAGGMHNPDGQDHQEFSSRDFHQSALVTEVMAQVAGTTAYECFGRHGPLALLPAGEIHSPRYAVVWCDEPAVTAARAALSAEQLSRELSEAFVAYRGTRPALGPLRVCSGVDVAPLIRVRRTRSAVANEVWIGNAAQALHPVAGQGLNLGLRDAFELARALTDNDYAANPDEPSRVLQGFAARRRFDRRVTTGVTDLLAAGFTWPLARPLQSGLLTAMDLLPGVRQPLASALLFGSR